MSPLPGLGRSMTTNREDKTHASQDDDDDEEEEKEEEEEDRSIDRVVGPMSGDVRARPAPTSPTQGSAGRVAPALTEDARSAAAGLAGSAYPYPVPYA
eukprot:7344213-Pyramimonas_sp.AAC.1